MLRITKPGICASAWSYTTANFHPAWDIILSGNSVSSWARMEDKTYRLSPDGDKKTSKGTKFQIFLKLCFLSKLSLTYFVPLFLADSQPIQELNWFRLKYWIILSLHRRYHDGSDRRGPPNNSSAVVMRRDSRRSVNNQRTIKFCCFILFNLNLCTYDSLLFLRRLLVIKIIECFLKVFPYGIMRFDFRVCIILLGLA